MIGIFIGISAVVSLISLGQGLQVAIEEQFQAVGTDKIFVTPGSGFGPPGSAAIKLEGRDKSIIERTKGVKDAGAMSFTFADVTFDEHTHFVPVNGNFFRRKRYSTRSIFYRSRTRKRLENRR